MKNGSRNAPITVLKNVSLSRKISVTISIVMVEMSTTIERSNPSRDSKMIASPVIPPAAIECGARNILTQAATRATANAMKNSFLIHCQNLYCFDFFN